MDDKIAANRRLWDEWARIHPDTQFYDMAGFRAGQTSLKHIELEEVGDVRGKSLLHLQCHFGQDTLSWARLGAKVTGVDLSPEAIRRAEALAAEAGIADARFVVGNVLDPVALGDAQFDLVFTSYGALPWLPDLNAWGRTISKHLKPGGRFHIVEFHPAFFMLDMEGQGIDVSYFNTGEALRFESTSSYTGSTHAPIESFEWAHSLSEVVNALIGAGLTLECLNEFPYCVHNCWKFLVEAEPGRFVIKHHPGKVPLLFSITARK